MTPPAPPQIPQMQNPDALRRSANAALALLTASGATAARPLQPFVGQPYFDTTLGRPVWWAGAHWVDATGATV